MREMALGWGVPEAAVVIESFSHNTLENARETARLLGLRGLRSVLLVSNRTHLPRAILLFRFAGLDVVGWAAAMPPSTTCAARAAIRECAALPASLLLLAFRAGSRWYWRR